jgi:hypothetical protein
VRSGDLHGPYARSADSKNPLLSRFGGLRFRLALVILLAVVSLATSVPNYLYMLFPIYGHFGFYADPSWRVQWARDGSPLRVGDVIDWRAVPFSERYDTSEFARLARTGTRVVFPVIRNGARLDIPLVAEYHKERYHFPTGLWLYGFKKSAELLIVLLGAALALIRPTRLSWLFFLYAASLAADGAPFWSFLPASVYFAVSCVAGVIALPLPAVALGLFALHLSDEAPRGWRAAMLRAAPYFFALLSALWIGVFTREQFAILWGTWLPNAATAATALAWIVSFGFLLTDVVVARRAHLRALSWACAALALSAFCYVYVYAGSLAPTDIVPYPDNEYAALLSLLFALAAVFIIVRGRIIDVRFIVTRAALSAVIAYSVIFAFALLNLALVPQIIRIAYLVPIEIVAAVLLGYRLSGLQDAAAALDLTDSGQKAPFRGDRQSGRDMLARALARAERTRNASLIATVRAHAAFSAWFAGEDREFESNIKALDAIVGDKPMQSLRRFAKSAQRTFVDGVRERAELPEWTARSELVLCGASDDSAEARDHAALAVAAADASTDPFLQVLARVALAEFDIENRRTLYDEARACCDRAGALQLGHAIRAISTGKQDVGVLEAFVKVRLRAPRPRRPTLDIRFADPCARVRGVPVKLHPREFALLLTIAEKPDGASIDGLSDLLWPELDGDAARNALYVCMHRLRKALGDEAAIARTATGYRLRDGAIVDLWTMQRLVDSTSGDRDLDDDERKRLADAFEALRAGRPHRPTELQWFLGIERTIERLTRDMGRRLAENALAQGEYERAVSIATALLEDDPLDKIARELTIQCQAFVSQR